MTLTIYTKIFTKWTAVLTKITSTQEGKISLYQVYQIPYVNETLKVRC